ncbi:S-methyl-5'-thioadenosine phosphorylase [Vitiosangium sp. GDMCC 1.1324]|uniref:S-methyl-5'-thioadenosine phosphorylase n=1 Tax=Vitiosangium sp. (strain GDMCC 1.1324) TaxID=2138576 RepID=UPI000D38006E|nr:S-methyl-5'-thioadenosine phosphorylase [Vitiosangium sp. GDMCC 1.1324]PTL84520.1 S-methyl-5'-thioadenosine phosphorylase [Vitiosangium sp. GDMCC 1.1324]
MMGTTAGGARIGIIGGSGLSKLLALSNVERVKVETPFGSPSDEVVLGTLGRSQVAFLQRHGPGHQIPPAQINVRANIAALKHVGCTQLLSLSAVGSLREDCPPGTFVLVDQFIDRTIQREKTFFGRGLVGHVPFGDPTCQRMRTLVAGVAAELKLPAVNGGTYVVMEGPQFSTRAESNLYRSWGGSVIGMTAMPEAKLAREAEMCYTLVAMITDYDCWYESHEPVTADLVSERMGRIAGQANSLVEKACAVLSGHRELCSCGCNRALDTAIMTSPSHRSPVMLRNLGFVVPRILNQAG